MQRLPFCLEEDRRAESSFSTFHALAPAEYRNPHLCLWEHTTYACCVCLLPHHVHVNVCKEKLQAGAGQQLPGKPFSPGPTIIPSPSPSEHQWMPETKLNSLKSLSFITEKTHPFCTLMCMSVHGCHTCVLKPYRGNGSSGIGVRDSCELPLGIGK